MSNETSLLPLQKTCESLKKIQETLTPFLDLVDRYNNQQQTAGTNNKDKDKDNDQKIDLYQITEAQAAIALSMGTLRYMALRLKGQKSKGSAKSDPLRMELNKIRKTLVELRKLKKKIKPTNSSSNGNSSSSSSSKKRKTNENDEQQGTTTTTKGSPKRQK